MMVQSFFFSFLLLPLCVVFYFTFALSVCGSGVTVLDVCRNVAVLFLYFSFLFLEVFELSSPNVSLTVSCSPCFINTAKYDKHTLVFVFQVFLPGRNPFPRPSA